MLKEFLQYVVGLGTQANKPEVEAIHGLPHVREGNGQVVGVGKPMAKALKATGLYAVRNYLEVGEVEGALVNVGPDAVEVFGPVDPLLRQRERLLMATPHPRSSFGYGRFMDVETFVIDLMTRFQKTEERDELQKLVSSLIKENSIQTDDDGVSQSAIVKRGVKRAETTITNPISLIPFRGYNELGWTLEKLVVRLNDDSDHIRIGLFEVDRAGWEYEHMVKVRDWLVTEIDPTHTVI